MFERTDSDAGTRHDEADVPVDADAPAEPDEPVRPADDPDDPTDAYTHAHAAQGADADVPAQAASPVDADIPAQAGAPMDADIPVQAGAPVSSGTEPGPRDLPGAGTSGDTEGPLVAEAEELRASLRHLQAEFVDDPRGAVSEAAELVDHAAQALVGALRQRQRQAREMWDGEESPDTEGLRFALQRYRALFNQICPP